MDFLSWLISKATGLPPPENRVRVERDIAVDSNGVTLLTDHFIPIRDDPCPTILTRLPYGRHGFAFVARSYAARGFHVVLQACRGTDGSTGLWEPLVHEREDGLATLAWLKAQPWFDGRLGVSGPSYMGYCTWAISDALPPHAVISTKVTSAEFESVAFPNGALHLQLLASWLQTVEDLRQRASLMALIILTGGIDRTTQTASRHLPLVEVDKMVLGRPSPFWRYWLEEAIDNPEFWGPLDHRGRITAATPPNTFVSGWYDFMVDQLLHDYRAMVEAGHDPYLTIGNWSHTSAGLNSDSVRETLLFMLAGLRGQKHLLRAKPVRIEISGLGWREYDRFPPPGERSRRFYLGPGRALTAAPPPPSEPDRYRYDPADPTPSLGGAIYAFRGTGAQDNRRLEARADVLTYTSQVLEHPLTVIGNAWVTLYVASSLEHTDFFARLCDVDAGGRSFNICDQLVRITPKREREPDGGYRLELPLHATAHRFAAGHRVRLQVSSGAHPRYARNLGTDEPIGTGTRMVAADQAVFHDPGRESCVTLPVFELE